jgi:hypothetical protein
MCTLSILLPSEQKYNQIFVALEHISPSTLNFPKEEGIEHKERKELDELLQWNK